MLGSEVVKNKRNWRSILFYCALVLITLGLCYSTYRWASRITTISNETVSEMASFYLKEIADRNADRIEEGIDRFKVLTDNLIKNIPSSLTKPEDIKEYMRLFQDNALLGQFMLLDRNGMLYSKEESFKGSSKYSFLSNDIKETKVFNYEDEKKNQYVVIVVPNTYNYRTNNIRAGVFIAEAGEIINGQILQGDENQTFCRLFTSEGDNIIGIPGEYPVGENLFDIYREKVSFHSGYGLNQLEYDWENHKDGYSIYSNEAGISYLYYRPVKSINWVTTALMRESTLTKTIESGAEKTKASSIMNLVIVTASIILLAGLILYALKKVNDAQSEIREVGFIGALSTEYSEICLLDMKQEKSTVLKTNHKTVEPSDRTTRNYYDAWDRFLRMFVAEDDRDECKKNLTLTMVQQSLKNMKEYSFAFRIVLEDGLHNIEAKYVAFNKDASVVIMGLKNVDEIVDRENKRRERLEMALEAADSANKAKTDFLFNMSHDIRTPMNAIIGFADLLEKHGDDSEKRLDYTKKIQDSSKYMLELINNVLEMARIESGKTTLDESPTTVVGFNDTLVSVFEGQIKEKNLTLIREFDVIHKNILCDVVKLKEIYLNILSNAVKYTPNGGSIKMKLRELPSDKAGYANFETTITDTGIGMSPDYLPLIFEEFTRERNSTMSKVGGTGLGMPITKRLVDLMNGSIRVESELGKGTTFVVSIPHRLMPDDAIFDEENDNPVVEPDEFLGRRILLAEDNELNAEIALAILTESGFQVEVAKDGIICFDMLQKAETGYYDLILMDVQMPNMGGYDTTRRIRSLNNDKSDIPIIAMTANAFEEDKLEALEAGMNGHIAKPISVKLLYRELRSILC